MNDHRLSQIETAWSIVRRAHGDESIAARSAQEHLLHQYGSAIQRYLLAALRDQTAADDVYQDFAVRFVRGDFHNASQDRGRFRSFLKTSLFRLVADYFRAKKKLPAIALDSEVVVADDSSDVVDREQEFLQIWRDEMLKRAWAALSAAEAETGKPWFTVMRLRVDHPDLRSTALAKVIGEELGKPVSPANARVLLHRSREKFSNLLIDSVSDSLSTTNINEVEEELAELELLEYCQAILEERKRQSPPEGS